MDFFFLEGTGFLVSTLDFKVPDKLHVTGILYDNLERWGFVFCFCFVSVYFGSDYKNLPSL